jgi:hypothetical protein
MPGKFKLTESGWERIWTSAAAEVPAHTRELLERYGLRVPPQGMRYPLDALDTHLKDVPVDQRLLVKSELRRRGWL